MPSSHAKDRLESILLHLAPANTVDPAYAPLREDEIVVEAIATFGRILTPEEHELWEIVRREMNEEPIPLPDDDPEEGGDARLLYQTQETANNPQQPVRLAAQASNQLEPIVHHLPTADTINRACTEPRKDEVVSSAILTPGMIRTQDEWEAVDLEMAEIDRTMVPVPEGNNDDPGDSSIIEEYKDELPMRIDEPLTGPDGNRERWYDTIGMSDTTKSGTGKQANTDRGRMFFLHQETKVATWDAWNANSNDHHLLDK